MSVEILVPFTLDPLTGKVMQTSDPNVQQMQHVASLVSTQPHERVMHPDYGIPISSYVFQTGASIVARQITTDVTQQMAQWEPGIQVLGVIPIADDQLGVARVDVEFETSPEATGVTQTATVHVGGTVS